MSKIKYFYLVLIVIFLVLISFFSGRYYESTLNKTVVIVMHDINFASVYSDNIVVLKNGKLAKNDTTDKIINKETLEDIYEIDFDIREINGKKISIYF